MNKETTQQSSLGICVPGQRLSLSTENVVSGQGTYERQGYIYSTLVGVLNVRKNESTKVIEVKPVGSQTIVPLSGDVVTARITQVNQRFAKCSIHCIGSHVLKLNKPYRGILRKEDVRATEKDRIEMYKCFRPGDIILAKILPQTELSSYQLTTAENELGVVIAKANENASLNGAPMVPISWTEMQCPDTLIRELRKVAKIISEDAMINKTENQ